MTLTHRTRRRGRRSLAAILAAMLMASVLAVVAGSPAHAANTSSEVLVDHDDDAKTASVREFGGRDRYDTALRLAKDFAVGKGGLGSVPAAVAAKLGGGAAWCGGEDPAAILVNGGDVSLAEAMMAGPIAHRLQLPVLLTAADELASATTDFIEAEDIEHVIIVGGTDSVSEDVADAVSDAGVDTVARIAGDTAAGTSAALAGLLTGDCKDDLAPVSDDTVALVNRDALPDGVAAAPVLSSNSDFAGGDLVPILVVGDTLPASVRDYLAATPQANDNGDKLELGIVAIGGTAAVSSSVMDAALAAAASADALTVKIGSGGTAQAGSVEAVDPVDLNKDNVVDGDDVSQVGDTRVRLYFSDNVAGDDTDTADVNELTNAIRDILEINGVPARLTEVTQEFGANAACDADLVIVTLANALKAGDTISVIGGAKLGSNADKRAVSGASRTVAAAAVDRSRPTVSVVLIAGQGTANITTSEIPEVAALEDGAAVKLRRAAGGAEADITPTGDLALTFAPELAAGDRITISSGAVEDAAENKSLQRSFTAIKAQASPRITSVLMSSLNHSAHAVGAVPASITGGAGTADARGDAPDIWIVAKGDGDAAGAVGNDWTVTFDRASTYDAAKDLDIDVRVNSRDQSVFVRFNNGAAKFADLKAALEANSAFDALFEVKVDADPATVTGGACGKEANLALAIPTLARGADASRTTLADGMTKAAIQVTFNAYISAVGHGNLLQDVLADALPRYQQVDAVFDIESVLTFLGWGETGSVTDDRITATFPGTKVTYSMTTARAFALPQPRDLVVTTGVAATDLDTTNYNDILSVATGYAADVDTTANVDEGKNGPSQVRIAASSAVEAPK